MRLPSRPLLTALALWAALGGPALARSGSGSIVGEDGMVLTAAHVFEGCAALAVLLPDGRRLPARLAGIDPIGDLALLRIPLAGGAPARLREDVAPGEQVEHHGFPAGARAAGRTIRSDVAALGGPRGERDTLTLAGDLRAGESGAGVFDAWGNLVGMAYGGRDPTWYAVGAGRIAEFLLLHGVPVATGAPGAAPLPPGESRRTAVRVVCQGPAAPPRR